MLRQLSLTGLLIVAITLTACSANNNPENPSNPASEAAIETEANREGVFIVRDEQREALPVEEQVLLNVGEGIVVDEAGRATFRRAGLLTAELYQAGQVTLQELSVDEESTAITLRQNGGILLSEFNPDKRGDHLLAVETDFANITTTGARLVVVREINSPLEWIVNLGSAEDEVQVTAGGVTRTLLDDTARWVAPGAAPSQRISVDTRRLRAWFNNVQNGESQLALGEVLLSPANTIGNTGSLTALPGPGRPFELENNEQGAVKLTLDPIGLFGKPGYALEDCNDDGRQDIVLRAGKLQFDFRSMLARALALDVTVINRDQPGNGALWARDPAGDEIDRQLLEAGPGQGQTLSLHSGQPFHTAELAMSNGCFLGFSLTPPSSTGAPGEPRPAATVQPGDTVVNVLEPDPRTPGADRIEALPLNTVNTVNAGDEVAIIQIDGEPDDWDALTEQSGLDWTSFDAITYDQGCANRYPGAEAAVDLDGQVRFAYDERNLYVAFQVDDDGYVGYPGDDQNYFLGDSPQLSLDMDLPGDLNDANRNEDDWQVDFQPDFESPQVALWQLGSLTSRRFDEAQVAASPTTTGYFLEAALPWQSFDASPQPGDRLGLAANINDSDTPGATAQECIISTAPQRKWNAPTTWGTLLLRLAGQ